MTSRKSPKIQTPEDPAPTAQPIPGREEEEAKKKVRRRAGRGGRQSTILAGKLNAQRNGNNILNTRLG
jgi:hypothetical protein